VTIQAFFSEQLPGFFQESYFELITTTSGVSQLNSVALGLGPFGTPDKEKAP